jgi:septum formation protein
VTEQLVRAAEATCACGHFPLCNDVAVAASLDLYLASKSPRRRELLTQACIGFALCEPGAEYVAGSSEHRHEVGDPAELAVTRARRKALGAACPATGIPVLAVDTVVDLSGQELGKAADRTAAAEILSRLFGKTPQVHTAHCLILPSAPHQIFAELATSGVACAWPSEEQLRRYLDSEQWRGKAGAYGIQDSAQDFLRLVSGAFDTVVGLHVPAVLRLLQQVRARQ